MLEVLLPVAELSSLLDEDVSLSFEQAVKNRKNRSRREVYRRINSGK